MNETVSTIWSTVRAGAYIALAGGGAYVAYHVARTVYDDLYARWVTRQQDAATIADLRQQIKMAALREIRPDAQGRYPLLFGPNGVIRDPASLRAFTLDAVLERWPVLDQMEFRLEALRQLVQLKLPGSYHNEVLIGDGNEPGGEDLEEGGPSWARVYAMRDLLGARTASIERLIVGVRPTESGGLDVVTRSLHELMHVLAVGASGWGKSTWLRAFLYQLARAPEPVEVVAIDTSGSALNALRGWGKLRYPVARSASDACAVLDQVSGEIDNRRRLYEQYPRVEDLREYNRASGQNMPPWVIVADESTHLLHHKGMGDPLRDVVQTARQYGIYLLMAGQTAHSKVIDSEIRDQFSSRLCFHTSPPSSRTVLDDSGAASIHEKGRAMVRLVGTELLELQGPWVSKDDFVGALSNGGPRHDMPVALASENEPRGPSSEDQAEILRMHAAGESKRAIQRAVFGYEGGAAYNQVTEVIERYGDTTGTRGTEDAHERGSDVQERTGTSTTAPDFCEFCDSEFGLFSECARCGVAICSDCADARGYCPDCQESE